MKRFLALTALFVLLTLPVCAGVDDFTSPTIHIGMVVSDMNASLHFYQDVIGMIQTGRTDFDIDAEFGKQSGLTDNLPFHVEVLRVGGSPQATELKIMSFGDRAQKQDNEYIHSHTGVQYITISVENLTPIIDRIKSANIPLLGETPIEMGDNSFVLVKDPDGTFIELIGPMKEVLPPTQYQQLMDKANFDKFKKTVPYYTPSRSDKDEEKEQAPVAKKKGLFSFFKWPFGSKDKSKEENGAAAASPQNASAPVDNAEDNSDQGKDVRNKFKRNNPSTPYETRSRSSSNRIIP